MSNPKVQARQKSNPSQQQEAFKKDSVSIFSEDQIRIRAYQIYESRDGNGNYAEEDWNQAQAELMDLVSGK